MASPQHGISDHLLLEAFERCHKHCLKIGISEFDAYRGALAFAFAASGNYTIDQAWETADEIMCPYATQPAAELESAANELI